MTLSALLLVITEHMSTCDMVMLRTNTAAFFFFFPQCCWNCGRKASETCSGCNAARYCGSFCQHKDWERHHLICSPGLQAQPKPVSAITAGRAASAAAAGVSPVGLAGVKAPDSVPSVSSPGGEKTSVASRSSTPSTPASAPETNGH